MSRPRLTPTSSRARLAPLLLAALLGGCASAREWVGIRLLYDRAPEPARVLSDVVYRPGSEHPKHRLDLFLPGGQGWPALIFVHGGGWTAGDKRLVVAGADVYGNIGRFYAGHGIGTAVVNYRLQPEVPWREQVDDVAHAVAWVRAHVAGHGGDPDAVFLSGHSAGAWLAAYAALNPAPLAELALDPGILCGVIPVSGLAFDLTDDETYRLGAERPYYEERFRDDDPGDGWQRRASALTYLAPGAPPFLLIYGSKEWPALAHQNRLLEEALRDAGVPSRLVVAKQSHESMVLALSREETLPAGAVLEFIRGSGC